MAHVTFTDLRNNLASHLDKIEADRTELVVTRQNHDPSSSSRFPSGKA